MDAPRHLAHWPVRLLLAALIAFQLLLPGQVGLGPSWLVPAVQALLLAPLVIANPVRLERHHPALRVLALVTAFVVLGANTARLAHLVLLIADDVAFTAGDLVLAAVVVLVTNVGGVAVVFWELDRGGPAARDPLHDVEEQDPDLLFPQMGLPDEAARAWRPGSSSTTCSSPSPPPRRSARRTPCR